MSSPSILPALGIYLSRAIRNAEETERLLVSALSGNPANSQPMLQRLLASTRVRLEQLRAEADQVEDAQHEVDLQTITSSR